MSIRTLFPVAAAAVFATSCGTPPPAPQTVRPVKVYTVESLGYVDKDFAGMAVADKAANLAFKVAGQVTELNIEEGKTVPQNAVIAEINPRDFALQVEADKSAYLTAKSQLERSKRLLDRQAISRQDYELTETRFAEAKSTYDNSRGILGDTKLRAPFAGIIEKQYVDKFQRVQSGEPIVRLVDPVTRTVRFTMPESGVRWLEQPDKSFTVRFDNYRNVVFSAYLKEYVKTSPDGTGLPVSLGINDPRFDTKKYLVSPGMSCTINLTIDNKADSTITAVPLTAVYSPDTGGDFVWVVRDDRVEPQAVSLGELTGSDMIVIRSGLRPGERVVTAGVYQLQEGQQVTILN
ncbi:MAG: efflux RND transporter periplasmic adaptor subunit [Rikenellaceae bacterium]|nr:efflux RND transporter periplasmic adaptor subunit [Rikenellaceae bacterium]